jgi:hypothetical protein
MEWHGASQLLVLLLRFAATGIARGQPKQPASSQYGGSTLAAVALADGSDGLARVELTGIRARACWMGPGPARLGAD